MTIGLTEPQEKCAVMAGEQEIGKSASNYEVLFDGQGFATVEMPQTFDCAFIQQKIAEYVAIITERNPIQLDLLSENPKYGYSGSAFFVTGCNTMGFQFHNFEIRTPETPVHLEP